MPLPDDPEGRLFLEHVLAMAGLPLGAYRAPPLQRRLQACLRTLGTRSPAAAVGILQRSPERLVPVLDSLLIGVTSFFRDPALFTALRRTALPDLLRRRPPRVWSVGCSDGAELYSIAMILADLGGPDALAGAELLGTDCRPGAVRRAVAGWFGAPDGGLPAPGAAAYVQREGSGWRVVPEIRRRVRFERADVLAAVPGGSFDLILCRNLVIYLAPDAVPDLWARLLACLEPGGYLAVGKAERVRAGGLRGIAPCLYRCEETDAH